MRQSFLLMTTGNIKSGLIVATVLLAACFGGCTPSESKPTERIVDGQAFTTEGLDTVRLPLAEVYVLEPSAASTLIRALEQRRKTRLADLDHELTTATADLKAFDDAQQPALDNAQSAWEQFQRLFDQETIVREAMKARGRTWEQTKALIDRNDEIGRQMDECRLSMKPKEELTKLLTERAQLVAKRDSVPERQVLLQSLSSYILPGDFPATLKATSDVDGKFTFKSPIEDIVVFAQFQSKGVHYFWLVNVRKEQGPVMLTNKNILDSPAPENLASRH